MNKGLAVSKNNAVVLGVCGGIAEHSNKKSSTIRILFIFITILSLGSSMLVYAVMYLAMVENYDKDRDKLKKDVKKYLPYAIMYNSMCKQNNKKNYDYNNINTDFQNNTNTYNPSSFSNNINVGANIYNQDSGYGTSNIGIQNSHTSNNLLNGLASSESITNAFASIDNSVISSSHRGSYSQNYDHSDYTTNRLNESSCNNSGFSCMGNAIAFAYAMKKLDEARKENENNKGDINKD